MSELSKPNIFESIGIFLKSHPRLAGAFFALVGAGILLHAIFAKQLSGTDRMAQSISVFGHLGTRIILGIMGAIIFLIGTVWTIQGWNPYN